MNPNPIWMAISDHTSISESLSHFNKPFFPSTSLRALLGMCHLWLRVPGTCKKHKLGCLHPSRQEAQGWIENELIEQTLKFIDSYWSFSNLLIKVFSTWFKKTYTLPNKKQQNVSNYISLNVPKCFKEMSWQAMYFKAWDYLKFFKLSSFSGLPWWLRR